MKYALNLSEDDRILSACVVLPDGNYTNMPIEDKLPDGDVTDYRYLNKSYVYDPLPEPAEPDSPPSVWEQLDAAYQRGVDSV